MSWYWIVTIVVVWLIGWIWGSLQMYNRPMMVAKRAHYSKYQRLVRIGVPSVLKGLFWPYIGWIMCIQQWYKRQLAMDRTVLSGDAVGIVLISFAWPLVFTGQYLWRRHRSAS